MRRQSARPGSVRTDWLTSEVHRIFFSLMQMEELPQEVAEPRLIYLTLLTGVTLMTMLGCQDGSKTFIVYPAHFQLDGRTIMKSREGGGWWLIINILTSTSSAWETPRHWRQLKVRSDMITYVGSSLLSQSSLSWRRSGYQIISTSPSPAPTMKSKSLLLVSPEMSPSPPAQQPAPSANCQQFCVGL